MGLIIEDGTIVADADSYVTLAAYQAYGAALGWMLGADDAADEINLRRAFQGLNRNWIYRGMVVDIDQVGEWPRDALGVPKAIKDAQCELAYLIQGGLDLFATQDTSTTSESIKIGPITISEDTLPTGKARVVAVTSLLRPYLASGAGQIALLRG